MRQPREGERHTVERTFTREDVQQFADLSGDDQARHTDPDDDGRVMVQGLLTASVPTSIGGDLEVLARSVDIEFVRPVYTGETVTCTWTTEAVLERADRYEVTADVVCETDEGVVLNGTFDGLVWKS